MLLLWAYANIFMGKLEHPVVSHAPFKPLFYKRYINAYTHANSFHPWSNQRCGPWGDEKIPTYQTHVMKLLISSRQNPKSISTKEITLLSLLITSQIKLNC